MWESVGDDKVVIFITLGFSLEFSQIQNVS